MTALALNELNVSKNQIYTLLRNITCQLRVFTVLFTKLGQ